MTADHRSGARRLGAALEDAIPEAALQELAEVGFARMSVESVARRARRGEDVVVRPSARKLQASKALLQVHFLTHGAPIDDADIEGTSTRSQPLLTPGPRPAGSEDRDATVT